MPENRRLSRVVRDCDGAAVIEYALLLAIAGGALSIVGSAAGDGVRHATEGLAAGLEGETHPHSAAAKSSGLPTPASASDACSCESAGTGWQVLAMVAVLLVGCPVWWTLRRKRRAAEAGKDDPAKGEDRAAEPPGTPAAALVARRQDILRILSHNSSLLLSGGLRVRHLMTPHPPTVPQTTAIEEAAVSPDTSIGAAVTCLVNRGTSGLPVIEHEQQVATLTTIDLLIALQCTLQVLQKLAAETELDPAAREEQQSEAAGIG